MRDQNLPETSGQEKLDPLSAPNSHPRYSPREWPGPSRLPRTTSHASRSSKTSPRIAAFLGATLLVLGAVFGGAWLSSRASSTRVLEVEAAHAVAAGKELAAELAGKDPSIAAHQVIGGPDMFHYQPGRNDFGRGADGFPYLSNQLIVEAPGPAGLAYAERIAKQLDAKVVGVNTAAGHYQLLLPWRHTETDLLALAESVRGLNLEESVHPNAVLPLTNEPEDRSELAEMPADTWGESLQNSPGTNPASVGTWGMKAVGAPAIWNYFHHVGLEQVAVGVVDKFAPGCWTHPNLPADYRPYLREATLADVSRCDEARLPSTISSAAVDESGLHAAGLLAAGAGNLPGPSSESAASTQPLSAEAVAPEELRGVAPNATFKIAAVADTDPADEAWFVDVFSLSAAISDTVVRGAQVVAFPAGFDTEWAFEQNAEQNANQFLDPAALRLKTFSTDLAADLVELRETSPDFLLFVPADTAVRQTESEAEEVGLAGSVLDSQPSLGDNLVTVAAAGRAGAAAVTAPGGLEVLPYGQAAADVVAPGSTALSAGIGGTHLLLSGPAQAVPYAAGTAAVIIGGNPELSAAQVKRILIDSATATPVLTKAGNGDDIAGYGPLVNAPAALQAALQTEGKGGTGADLELDRLFNEPSLPVSLHGTWCTSSGGEISGAAGNCLNLEDYLAANPGSSLTDLRPEDVTGRGTISSTFTLKTPEGSIRFTYFPPGAASASELTGDPLSAHNVAWPRIIPSSRTSDADGNETGPLLLNLAAVGPYPSLPEGVAVQPSRVPDYLRGTWCNDMVQTGTDADSPEEKVWCQHEPDRDPEWCTRDVTGKGGCINFDDLFDEYPEGWWDTTIPGSIIPPDTDPGTSFMFSFCPAPPSYTADGSAVCDWTEGTSPRQPSAGYFYGIYDPAGQAFCFAVPEGEQCRSQIIGSHDLNQPRLRDFAGFPSSLHDVSPSYRVED